MSWNFSRVSATLVASSCENIPLIEAELIRQALWLCRTNPLTRSAGKYARVLTNAYQRVFAACFPSFFKRRSNISRSFFERTLTAVSIAAACSRNPRVISARPFAVSSTRRTRRSSARFFRKTSPFLTSRSTATLIDPGVSQTFGPTVLTGSGPL